METINRQKQQGFVALMTVIIISAILLVMMVTAAGIAYRGRFNALDYENKKISVALAEACVQTAMVNLAQNSGYNPPSCGECVGVEDSCDAINCQPNPDKRVCRICEITAGGTVIHARAAYKGVFTNLTANVILGDTDVTLDSMAETESSLYAASCIP